MVKGTQGPGQESHATEADDLEGGPAEVRTQLAPRPACPYPGTSLSTKKRLQHAQGTVQLEPLFAASPPLWAGTATSLQRAQDLCPGSSPPWDALPNGSCTTDSVKQVTA